MKFEAWRIVKDKHVSTAFSGEGAAKFAGRWNSRGVAIVYTSATRSLAVLETLVHLNPPIEFNYQIIRIEFDDNMLETLVSDKLAPDWRMEPPPPSTRQLGDEWARSLRSPVLAVPSVIIPEETNYLFNPTHPDFKTVVIGKPTPLGFDPRLLVSWDSNRSRV